MILIVAAFAATITSCQKQKLEKLSGTWVQIDKESTSSEFFPDEYYDVSFDCDSFSFKRKLCDDAYIVSCNCNCTEYIIKGTYKLEKSTLTLDGLYVELYDKYKNNPVPINYSNPDDKAPSPESNPNPPLPVITMVVLYTTIKLIGQKFE